jgi:hypothetical protein
MSDSISISIEEVEMNLALEKMRQELEAQRQENERQAKRIADLEVLKQTHDEAATAKLEAANLRIAEKESRQRHEPLNLTQGELKRNEAIRRCGGPAFWTKKSLEQRMEALSIPNDPEATDKSLREIFGRTSSSVKAVALASSNPSRYKLWRQIAREKNII